MTWQEFIFIYPVIAIAVVVAGHKLFSGNVILLIKINVVGISIGFLFDHLGSSREIWRFPKLFGVFIISNPIENTIFIACTTTLLLGIHLWIRRTLPFQKDSAHTNKQSQ